jgi:hypothetical protein
MLLDYKEKYANRNYKSLYKKYKIKYLNLKGGNLDVLNQIKEIYNKKIKELVFPPPKNELYLINRHYSFSNIIIVNPFQEAINQMFINRNMLGGERIEIIPVLSDSLKLLKDSQRNLFNFLKTNSKSTNITDQEKSTYIYYNIKMITQEIIEFQYIKLPKSEKYDNKLFLTLNRSNYLKHFKIARNKRELNKLEDQLLDQEKIAISYNELGITSISEDQDIFIKIIRGFDREDNPIYFSNKFLLFKIKQNDKVNKILYLSLFMIKQFDISEKELDNNPISQTNPNLNKLLDKESFNKCRPGDIVKLYDNYDNELRSLFLIENFDDKFQQLKLIDLTDNTSVILNINPEPITFIQFIQNHEINRNPFFYDDIIFDQEGNISFRNLVPIPFNYKDKVVTIKKVQFPKYDLLYRIQNIIRETNLLRRQINNKLPFLRSFYQLAVEYNLKLVEYYKSLHRLSLIEFPSTKLINQKLEIVEDNKEKPILIIGSGPVGMITAIKMKRKFNNCKIIIVDNRTINSDYRKQFDRFQLIDLKYESLKNERDLYQYLLPIIHRDKGKSDYNSVDNRIESVSIVIRLLETILSYYCLNIGINFEFVSKDYNLDSLINKIKPKILINCSGKQKLKSDLINLVTDDWIKTNITNYQNIKVFKENMYEINPSDPFYLKYDPTNNYYNYVNQDGDDHKKYTTYIYCPKIKEVMKTSDLSGLNSVAYKDENNLVVSFSEETFNRLTRLFNNLNVKVITNKMIIFDDVYNLIFDNLKNEVEERKEQINQVDKDRSNKLLNFIDKLKNINDLVITKPWISSIKFSAISSQIINNSENTFLYFLLGQSFDYDYYGTGDATNKWFRFLEGFLNELKQDNKIIDFINN